MIPVVAQTVAFFCERPMAKAFGTSVSATAIFGLGRSAWMQSRSIIACSPGASSGETSLAPIAASAELVREEQLRERSGRRRSRAITTAPAPAASSAADEGHVEQAEQEQREQHPDLQAGVAGEDRLLGRHDRSVVRCRMLAPRRELPSCRVLGARMLNCPAQGVNGEPRPMSRGRACSSASVAPGARALSVTPQAPRARMTMKKLFWCPCPGPGGLRAAAPPGQTAPLSKRIEAKRAAGRAGQAQGGRPDQDIQRYNNRIAGLQGEIRGTQRRLTHRPGRARRRARRAAGGARRPGGGARPARARPLRARGRPRRPRRPAGRALQGRPARRPDRGAGGRRLRRPARAHRVPGADLRPGPRDRDRV